MKFFLMPLMVFCVIETGFHMERLKRFSVLRLGPGTVRGPFSRALNQP